MNSIFILTGAGISAESGLSTFRGGGGLWENHRIEDVASPEGFARDPSLVQNFYNERRRQLRLPHIVPNAAHEALAKLEREWPGEVLVVTQNVDDLHERGGSKRVLHMHGELLEARCTKSGKVEPWEEDITPESVCGCCGRTGTLRPNIVWFGEVPMSLEAILPALAECSHFAAIGTSGNVYPAAGFIEEVRRAGNAHTIELNLEPSATKSLFAEQIYGKATDVVPTFVERLLHGSVS